MRSAFVVWMFELAALLPLGALHRIGGLLGRISYLLSGTYAARMRANLALAYGDRAPAESRTILRAAITETGKGLLEIPWVWRRPLQEVIGSVRECHGWEHVEAGLARGRGIIFLTPHLGCFEVSALYAARRVPITVLYRPPRLAWLEAVVRRGRGRARVHLARTDVGGVRLLFKALKRGEAIGLLPDQVPGKGEGEWADFFGRPAYTMSLVARLAESSGAPMLMAYAERLPHGAGYVIHIAPLAFDPGLPAARQLNAALEATVRACPAQYLWGYNRYKVPPGVEPPRHQSEAD
jgi:KDO2-lipid IV(A) lauroyltransferase